MIPPRKLPLNAVCMSSMGDETRIPTKYPLVSMMMNWHLASMLILLLFNIAQDFLKIILGPSFHPRLVLKMTSHTSFAR